MTEVATVRFVAQCFAYVVDAREYSARSFAARSKLVCAAKTKPTITTPKRSWLGSEYFSRSHHVLQKGVRFAVDRVLRLSRSAARPASRLSRLRLVTLAISTGYEMGFTSLNTGWVPQGASVTLAVADDTMQMTTHHRAVGRFDQQPNQPPYLPESTFPVVRSSPYRKASLAYVTDNSALSPDTIREP